MDFYLIGTDYRRADITLRDQLFRKRNEIFSFWKRISHTAALFSTCNRIEIYGFGNKNALLPQIPRNWYFISGKAQIFRHALRLAVGLESQLKGEVQILEQINIWKKSLPADLIDIWEAAYSKAREVRNDSGLIEENYNIATVLYDELQEYAPNHRLLEAVVIGTGKIAETLAKQRPEFAHLVFAAHKNRKRAEELAAYAQGKVINLEGLAQALRGADILISATSSPHYILRKEQIKQIVSGRDSLLRIYDLAIPRDIDPQVNEIKGATLKNLDDLSSNFEKHNKTIQAKLDLAEYLVEERVKEYEKNIKVREPSESVSLTSSG